jgi:DNA-binding response OmpR family regulator/Tfp pilus assembly protein PilF
VSRVVLHIDEDPTLPAGVAEELARQGCELLQTGDPEQAMRWVEERKPALVLAEIELAGCDGPDLLSGVCSVSDAPPLVVLTKAQHSSPIYGEAVALGATDVLSKPVLAETLLSRIQVLASRSPQTEEIQRPSGSQSVGMCGDLALTPLPELLARLNRRGDSGVLMVKRSRARLAVQVRNGSPVAVSSNRRAQPRGTAEKIAEVAEGELFEGFCWTEGSYKLVEGGRLKPDTALEISRDYTSLVLKGVFQKSPMAQVRDRLRKLASLYVSTVEAKRNTDGLGLTRDQVQYLSSLPGRTTVADVLESNLFEERLLYGIWVIGRLKLDTAPKPASDEEIGAAVDAVATADAAPGIEAPAPEPTPLPAEETRAEPAVSHPQDMPAQLVELSQRVLAVDDFEVLDVPLFAPDKQVHNAYERMLAEIPEGALDSTDANVRGRAMRIRDRIESAYEHLKDAETRRQHALLRQEKEQDGGAEASAERALEAERWFRKGEQCLMKRRYEEAAEGFGMAAHLDPDEGEYLAHLGYALYLSKPGDSVIQREAMEHVAAGVKRSPERPLSYIYLGRILRGQGDTDAARRVFQRALRIRPHFHIAQQVLRLLKAHAKQGKGILSKLFGR